MLDGLLKSFATTCMIKLVQWVPDYLNSRLSERLDIAMFFAAAGNRHSGHWSSATGESKAAV